MKITVTRKKLAEALKMANSVLASRSVLPILANVLVTAKDGNLTIAATDLQSRIEVMLPADELEEDSPVTLPAKKMLSLCDALSGDKIKLTSNEQFHSDLQCGSTKLNILGLNPADFPEFAKQETKHTVTMTGDDLRHLIEHGGYAISTEDARKALCGMFLSCEENKIVAVSTDGKRLALAEVTVTAPFETAFSCIIPLSAIAFLKSVCTGTEQIHFEISANQMTAKGGNFIYTTKLIEGNYPNWKQVVPSVTTTDVTIQTSEFLEKMRCNSMMATEVNSSVKFGFYTDLTSTMLKFSASGPAGTIEDDMEVKTDGAFEPFELSFNPFYILQAVKQHASTEFHFMLKDVNNPVKMSFGDGSLSVIMPMRSK